ncbi:MULTISPECIES: hypothetical protein [Paenibacillus]|uniref:hypothetical protein n=1 Tax=Paenibacillus TaxID=44249 RepID=UPI000385B3F6|nr:MULTISPECIES: hypothetical protein [Paenibacillus]EPY12200.1 hypothetical protein PAAL66ix_13556 [Paenibacillus alvei A6-6i-x]SDE46483.1 hypothetical protein SAMN04488689_101594 [Paenibacillus sp. cl6col]
MQHLDEKILAMMKELEEERQERDGEMREEDGGESGERGGNVKRESIDLNHPLISVNGQMIPLADRTLLAGKLHVRMPKTWRLMTQQEAAIKYPSVYRPSLIYTNNEGTVNLTINLTEDPLEEEGLAVYTETMARMIRSVQPIRSWIDEGMMDSDEGERAGYCEFTASVLDGTLYYYMMFKKLEGSALLVSFSCSAMDMRNWKPVAHAMMRAIQTLGSEKGEKRSESYL